MLVLASWFPSLAQPGLGSFVLEQVQALRKHCGIDARVIAGRPFHVDTLRPWHTIRNLLACRMARRHTHWREHDGVPVLDVPYAVGKPLPVGSHAVQYSSSVQAVAAGLRSVFPFDVVHAHTMYLDGTAAVALGRRHGVPTVVTEHTGPFRVLVRRPWTRMRIGSTLRWADRVFAVSESLARAMRETYPRHADRIAVLRNGVDVARFDRPASWTPDPSRPRLGAIGVFHANKAPLVLLAAFATLLRTLPGATLHLAGSGELLPDVRQACATMGIAHAVRCHGQLSRSDTAALLRDECDVLVISSRTETFGLSAIEAMACGKPVVTTRCGGPEEVVSDDSLGRQCAVDDAGALASALAEVCAELPRFDAASIRAAAVRRFSLTGVAAELTAVYDELAAQRRCRR